MLLEDSSWEALLDYIPQGEIIAAENANAGGNLGGYPIQFTFLFTYSFNKYLLDTY